MLYCNLGVFLKDLEVKEGLQGRAIPTIAELSQEVGVSRQALYAMVNNTVKGITFETGAKIIKAFRDRGIAMEVDDLIRYTEIPLPPEEQAGDSP